MEKKFPLPLEWNQIERTTYCTSLSLEAAVSTSAKSTRNAAMPTSAKSTHNAIVVRVGLENRFGLE